MLLKLLFLLSHLFCKVEFEFSWFHNIEQSGESLILKMLLEFQNKTNIEIIGFKLMHFGFALVSSDLDLGNIDLLNTHLDLLDGDIPSKSFSSSQDTLKMSLRRLEDVFNVKICRLPRRLARCLQDVFVRRLGRRKIVTLKTCWKCLQDKSWRRLENQQIFAGQFCRFLNLLHSRLLRRNFVLRLLFFNELCSSSSYHFFTTFPCYIQIINFFKWQLFIRII